MFLLNLLLQLLDNLFLNGTILKTSKRKKLRDSVQIYFLIVPSTIHLYYKTIFKVKTCKGSHLRLMSYISKKFQRLIKNVTSPVAVFSPF